MGRTLDFLDDSQAARQKRAFTQHERGIAKALGGRPTAASGALGMKGDVWAGNADAGQRFMVECKSTEKDPILIKLDWLDKLVKESREAAREPVLALRYYSGGYTFDFAAVPVDRWMTLADTAAPAPEVVVVGRQVSLGVHWFAARWESDVPTVLYFKLAKVRKAWALLPMLFLRALYAAESERRRAHG